MAGLRVEQNGHMGVADGTQFESSIETKRQGSFPLDTPDAEDESSVPDDSPTVLRPRAMLGWRSRRLRNEDGYQACVAIDLSLRPNDLAR